jgi:hypothetical protein
MTCRWAERAAFDASNILRRRMFRFPNILRRGEAAPASTFRERACAKDSAAVRGVWVWQRPWPLIAHAPIVSGALILGVAIALSRLMMSSVAHEQELGVRQIAAVYLDGIATTIYPHVAARNLANTTEALRRTMWFHQDMREQRAIVRLPDGTVFADVSGPNDDVGADDPLHDASLRRQLEQEGGFVFDAHNGTG